MIMNHMKNLAYNTGRLSGKLQQKLSKENRENAKQRIKAAGERMKEVAKDLKRSYDIGKAAK